MTPHATQTQSAVDSELAPGDSPNESARPPGLLVLLNPGRMSRHGLIDLLDAASRLGVPSFACELGEVWSALRSGRALDVAGFARNLQEKNVRAVLSYTANGLSEWPCDVDPNGQPRSFFEGLGIRQLLWWYDHPQWADEKSALHANVQPLLSSPNCHHFLKSDAAAREVSDILGWPNCHGLPVAENPDRLRPVEGVVPQFDIVTITGAPPMPMPGLERFLVEDDPDVSEIRRILAAEIRERLSALWASQSTDAPRVELEELGRQWTTAREQQPLVASHRLFRQIELNFPVAAKWLREHYQCYFSAIEALWEFARWERTFHIRYLARRFRVGVFGSDWSSVGVGPGGWVNHEDQPRVYALGRIALNNSQAGDEEGVAHKPFHIAASGVAMLHGNRAGLERLFTPGAEVGVFDSPRQARELAAELLADDSRRRAMADAALATLRARHTWTHRLARMLTIAGFPLCPAPIRQSATPHPPSSFGVDSPLASSSV